MARTLDFDSIQAAIDSVQAEIIEINMAENDIDTKVQQVKAAGAKVMLCYSGSDTDMFERMIALQPDMVNLDAPHLWKEAWYQTRQQTLGKTSSG